MRSVVLAILLLSPLAAPAPEPAADLLLTGGRVWTADPARPWAEAVAVRDGRVVFVGSDAEAARWKGRRRRSSRCGAASSPPASRTRTCTS